MWRVEFATVKVNYSALHRSAAKYSEVRTDSAVQCSAAKDGTVKGSDAQ